MTTRTRLIVVATLASLLARPTAAFGQAGKEELYSFRVPIHLTKLSPELTVVILHCYSSGSWYQPQKVIPQAHHEIKVVNAQVDTSIIVQMQTVVHPQDVGRPGVYTCEIGGRRPTDPAQFSSPFGPTEQGVAFRLTPALPPIQRSFTW